MRIDFYRFVRGVFIGLVLGWGASALRAEVPAPTAIPEGGRMLFTQDMLAFSARPEERAQATKVRADGAPGVGEVWRVETRVGATEWWMVELTAYTQRAVEKGSVGLLRFQARAEEAASETREAQLVAALQLGKGDYTASERVEFSLPVGAGWREFFVPFAWDRDMAAGEAMVALALGHQRQVIEIAGLEVIEYGDALTITDLPRTRYDYAGREEDAPWREAALARIEKIRRGPLVVAVRDANGAPVVGADVRVEQVRHAFPWGTAVQMRRLAGEAASEDDARYRAELKRLFNAAGPENGLKHGPWIGEWGADFAREKTMAGLEWLRRHGFMIRGHVLVWPSWANLPRAMKELHDRDPAAVLPAIEAHMRDILGATSGMAYEWDVLNEPYTHNDLMGLHGEGIQAEWFRLARELAGPDVRLTLNDFGIIEAGGTNEPHREHYLALARALLAEGAPLDVLGLQSHFAGTVTPPERLTALYDEIAATGLPIVITEFDINVSDEELQADYTRDFLIATFAHPAVIGFQMWGFWEGAHWMPRAAMFRSDWSAKPNLRVYEDLVLGRWWTREEGKSGADGHFATQAFFGRHRVTVRAADGREATLEVDVAAGETAEAVLVLMQ